MLKRFFASSILSSCILLAGSTSPCSTLRPGFEGGLHYTSQEFDDEDAVSEVSGLAGFAVGGFVEIPMGQGRSLIPGLRYLREGHDVIFDTGLDDPEGRHEGDLKITQDYVSMPLLFKASLQNLPGLFFKVGAEVGFLISARADGREREHVKNGDFIKIIDPKDEDISDHLRTARLSVDLGAGYEFPLGRHQGYVELRYDQGVSDTAKGERFFSNWQTGGVDVLFGLTW